MEEGVIQRPEVGIHLLGHVARQESQLLAGLDRRSAENDPIDLLLGQMADGGCDRQVGLAGAGGADGEDQIMIAHRVEIQLLVGTLGRHIAPVGRTQASGVEEILQHGAPIVAQQPQGDLDIPLLEAVPAAGHRDQLADQVRGDRLLLGVTLDRQIRAPRRDPDPEIGLDGPQIFVVVTEQVNQDFLWNRQPSHPVGCDLPPSCGPSRQGRNLTSGLPLVNEATVAKDETTYREERTYFVDDGESGRRSTLIESSWSCFSVTVPGAPVIRSMPLFVFGKAITSRIDADPVRIVMSLSTPRAIPPCGGAPMRSADRRKPNFDSASSSLMPSSRKTRACSALRWIRMLPPPTSIPSRTRSYACARTVSGLVSRRSTSSGQGAVNG